MHPNGHQSWPPPSTLDILLRIESRLGGLETGQDMTLQAVEASFRKVDHAHARITALDGRLARIEQGPPMARLTGFLTALGQVLPPLGTLAALAVWLTVALTVGINADTVGALIGLGP